MDDTSVKVAVRVRPQLAKERIDMCQICTNIVPGEPQIVLGKDKSFTFDYVFDLTTSQKYIYEHCAKDLINGTFEGYNATILAYGQTGSGKTYTMGTGFDLSLSEELVGIIPRAVEHLFNGIDERRRQAIDNNEPAPDFKVNAQFMELYNEEILDLLDTTRDPSEKGRKSHIRIHEDASGGIYTVGVATRPVNSLQDTMACLKLGALCRTTASTNMNAQSSRSHAIFTLHIRHQRLAKPESINNNSKDRDSTEALTEFEMLSAKFHFVDLAGSERLKRTGATGERAKEGISINCGLLALGNVISALGDKLKKGMHVPYRDSKLTRLLQDSLGGNSRTVMIACVSPSDRDFMETLNTLKYANRARNIKNKVMVNQDKTSRQMSAMRSEIQALQAELLQYRLGLHPVDGEGSENGFSDIHAENSMLQAEINNLRLRNKSLQEAVEAATMRNINLLADKDALDIVSVGPDNVSEEAKKYIERYIREMEEMRSRLVSAESVAESMRRSQQRNTPSRSSYSPMTTSLMSGTASASDFATTPEEQTNDILFIARQDLKRLKKKTAASNKENSSGKLNSSEDEKHDTEDNDGDEPEDEEANGVESESAYDDDDDDEDDDDATSDLETDNDEDDDSVFNGAGVLHENLADLTCDISIKEKLISELEHSQKQLHRLKVQYEEKLQALETKIRETQIERDRVLSSLSDVETVSNEKASKVREEFEKKLSDMQAEFKKLEAAKKEHTNLIRNQSQFETRFKTLQHELSDMKKQKVQLMNKIKEEAAKNRATEAQRSKEISNLRRDQQVKDSHIRTLEAEKRQKEKILKRKQEEVEALRKRQRPLMSAKVAGRIGTYDKEPTVPVNPVRRSGKLATGAAASKVNVKTAKAIWDRLEKSVSSIIVKKQTTGHIEKDMERWLKEREHLGKKLERIVVKQEKLVAENATEEDIKDINIQIANVKDNITYVQENINDCQSSIMQMEEAKEEEVDPLSLIGSCDVGELKYLLEKCVNLIISKGLVAAQKEAEIREQTAKLHQERMDSTFQRDMLHYLIQDKVDIEIDDSLIVNRENSESESEESSEEVAASDSTMIANGMSSSHAVKRLFDEMLKTQGSVNGGTVQLNGAVGAEASTSGSSFIGGRRDKARRKHATPEELLFAGGAPPLEIPLFHHSVEPYDVQSSDVRTSRVSASRQDDSSDTMPPPRTIPSRSSRSNGLTNTQIPQYNFRPDSIPLKSDSLSLPCHKTTNVGAMGVTRGLTVVHAAPSDPSPMLRRKVLSSSISSGSGSRLSIHSDQADLSPPTSPTFTRRGSQRDQQDNVFSRLTSRTQPVSPNPSRGSITAAPGKPPNTSCPLIHAYSAVGHAKAVLSVFATDSMLFTSSKDRTAKIWDLQTGEEILTLDSHPNNVVSVKYSEATNLVYTISTYLVKIWDPRQGNLCIKALSSAGLTYEGNQVSNLTSRQATCPPGESHITDMAVNTQGTVIYTTAGNTVRIWDLKSFKCVGKLSGGQQAAVMALAIDDTDTADGSICLVTGSKDHYIKVFEVYEDSIGVLSPKYNLEPPHYDGVQSLCLMGDLLFSGARDACIKKWDLSDQTLKHSINNAHKDWICGLAFMPSTNCLLSGCRSGVLKVWHIDNCSLVGELQAHNSAINSICANSTMLFSASNEADIKFWWPDCDSIAELFPESLDL